MSHTVKIPSRYSVFLAYNPQHFLLLRSREYSKKTEGLSSGLYELYTKDPYAWQLTGFQLTVWFVDVRQVLPVRSRRVTSVAVEQVALRSRSSTVVFGQRSEEPEYIHHKQWLAELMISIARIVKLGLA